MSNCSPEAEQLKADFLDWLYVQSGRTDGLYTGLWQEHCVRSGLEARQAWAELRTADDLDAKQVWDEVRVGDDLYSLNPFDR
jgi:hypothetical protein